MINGISIKTVATYGYGAGAGASLVGAVEGFTTAAEEEFVIKLR